MLYEMIQENFMGVVIILFLILFILVNNNFDKKTNHLFLASATCVLLFIVEEAWEGHLALGTNYSRVRVFLSAIGYTLRPMTAYFLVMIIFKNTRRWRALISVPIAINTVIAFSALISKGAFWYTETNEFVRGPWGFVPFVTAGFYLILILILTISESKKESIMETMTVLAIVILALIATVMESVFHFTSIQSAASGISITFYYLFLHTNQNNRDPLTGALVRRRFYLDAEKYRTALSAVISLDLNNLKILNDQYGHTAGDKALITMTQTVRGCIRRNSALYRTGGDEFMILCYKMSEEEVEALIEQIQAAMEKTEYRCAMGHAMYHHQSGLDYVCQIADKAMYENKINMKAKK